MLQTTTTHRKFLELLNGITEESKQLDVALSERYLSVTRPTQYIKDLIQCLGLTDSVTGVEWVENHMGEYLAINWEDALSYYIPMEEVVRAHTYAKLLNLGTGLLDIPGELYPDRQVLAYLNDIAILLGSDVPGAFSDSDVAAAVDAYKYWGESTSLIEHIQQAATAYLPGNGFRRDSIMTRALMAYHMLVLEHKRNASEASESQG